MEVEGRWGKNQRVHFGGLKINVGGESKRLEGNNETCKTQPLSTVKRHALFCSLMPCDFVILTDESLQLPSLVMTHI